jgi:signal transduction histidine kinase
VPDPVDIASLRPRQAQGLADDTLEELNRLWAVVRAFSNTAHDVNNALQVIAGNAELLESRELEPAVRRRVETIRMESGKAAATVNRLLDFARAPRQPVQTLDVWPLLESAASMRLASLGRGRVALGINRDGMAPVWLRGEPAQVQQTLLNLLLTAEDRVAGQPKARIDVAVAVERGAAVVTVAATSDAAAAPHEEEPLRAPAGLTRDTQLWAAGYLASLSHGSLTIDGGTLVVSWPPVDP